ncbi:PID-CTERM protein-sorting domain-containing protein [Hanamia caeni]|jgi:hypothetical protein|nr:hypothetical protein [Hanamia caeni]
MKANLKRFFIIGISLIMFLCSPAIINAQPGPEPEPPCVGPDPQTGECPIDSGLLFLIAAGAGYGIKKVVDSRKIGALKIAENQEK